MGNSLAHQVRILSAHDVESLIDMRAIIDTQRAVFEDYARGNVLLAPRGLLNGPEGSVAFAYAARNTVNDGAVCKFGSVNPANSTRQLPAISATVLVQHAETGYLRAILNGEPITTARTAGASAVAASALATPGRHELGIIGSGVQAHAHLEALAALDLVASVRVFSPSAERRAAFCKQAAQAFDFDVLEGESAQDVVSTSSLVVTATTSAQPVCEGAWVRPGTTVISVGSFAPDHREVDQALLDLADLVVVDDVETASQQAGPIAAAIAHAQTGASGDGVPTLYALGNVLNGTAPGRSNDEQIIFYNSVGLGFQDSAAAERIVQVAEERGMGQLVDLG
ncbi:ornithine cyclodeaminase family protein [Saxibacter everestensis]|uniref:Ornithine cyclodeaminase family protein n=1 Tax=Saxibacter everestensis TaxID=2909229 RepID=A0ABY8QTV1_9MICO|nr:ornithine cyclodeaminase family protein [Brevibacteriaceae bacterium ZFBP1038]